MKRIVFVFLFSVVVQFSVLAQPESTSNTAIPEDSTEADWEFETSVYYYSFPDEADNIIPIVYADYKSFHIEARYNYEDKNTASVFAGYRFETGNNLVLGATPMAGVVFGNTNGFAPGLLLDLVYNKFDFYSETEYIFDNTGNENNFLYTWLELAITSGEHIRAGLSANRTKIYQTAREIQHGVFGEYSFGKFTGGIHYFNPFSGDYFFIAMLNFRL